MKVTFKISEMHCESCSQLIAAELEDLGVSSKIDFKSGKAIIDFNSKLISEDKIKSIIKGLGYVIEGEVN